MDIDLFIARNSPTWDRLAELTSTARRTVARLTPEEVDELVALYQRTSSHLSHARTAYREPGLTMRLTTLVGQASGVIYRGRSQPGRAVADFFLWRFPAAVYQSGRFIAASAALFLVPALAMGLWMAHSNEALNVAWPDEVRQAYLDSEFEDYYSADGPANFAAQVTVNNIQVAFLAFAGGILLCIPTAWLMFSNGIYLGAVAGLFATAGQSGKFWGLVLPHGLLELTAVIIAGAAGMRMGWAIVAPGDRSRTEALGVEGRRAVLIALGLILAFMVAGFIEGFITGRGVPTALRVGIGIAAELAFLTWIVVQGHAATRRGLTGDLGELDRGWNELAAARERSWSK
ncbi:MAG TPA: stage II sporulation protein M [Acidimicrobiales bacterium]